MVTRRNYILTALALAVLTAGVAVVACDLNPQPLPPGDQAGTNIAEDAGATATPPYNAGGGGADGGADLGAADAGPVGTPVASGDGGGDGGAQDASDASTEDASDAQSDAPVDAGEEGG